MEKVLNESKERLREERAKIFTSDKYYFGCTLTNSILTKGYQLINSDDVL